MRSFALILCLGLSACGGGGSPSIQSQASSSMLPPPINTSIANTTPNNPSTNSITSGASTSSSNTGASSPSSGGTTSNTITIGSISTQPITSLCNGNPSNAFTPTAPATASYTQPTTSGLSSINQVNVSTQSGANNIIPLCVGADRVSVSANIPQISLTICVPGTSTCQTIDHILVDTGSTGLFLFSKQTQGVLDLAATPLPQAKDSNGNLLYDCMAYGGNSNAGGTYIADVYLNGSHYATQQTIGVFGTVENQASQLCSFNKNANQTINDYVLSNPQTQQVGLGFNGILGVGALKPSIDDSSTLSCNSQFQCTPFNWYNGTNLHGYSNILAQLNNDSNGFGLSIPSPSINVNGGFNGQALQGQLILGINTQTDNQVSVAQKIMTLIQPSSLTVIPSGFLNASLEQSTAQVLVDSGTNGILISSTFASYFAGLGITPTQPSNAISALQVASSTQQQTFSLTLTDAAQNTSTQSLSLTTNTVINPLWQSGVIPDFGFFFTNSNTAQNIILGIPFFMGKTIWFLEAGGTNPSSNEQGAGIYF